MDITGETRLLGLLGDPVSHSLSPRMHNMAFAQLGLPYVYLAFKANESELPAAVAGMRALNAKGFNLTMPDKKAIIPLLDEVTPEARMIGSVNTVVNRDGKLVGYNTDGKGFVRDLLEHGVSIKGKRILMGGAGGAARAVAIQLALDGAAELVVINRTLEKAVEIRDVIARDISSCKVEALELNEDRLRAKLVGADIFINSTALGMHPNEDSCILSGPDLLRPSLVVADFIYNPRKTKLLRMAEQAGCTAINGLGMLLWQGAEAFNIWTGADMPVSLVKKTVFPD